MNISRSKKRVYLVIGLGLIIIGLAVIAVTLAYSEQRKQDTATQNDAQDGAAGRRTPATIEVPRNDAPHADPDSVDPPPVPKTDKEETSGGQPARVKEGAEGARQQ